VIICAQVKDYTTPREAPTLSSKIRNRNAHIANGNTSNMSSPSQTRTGTALKSHTSSIQRRNLIPGAVHRKRKANDVDKENAEPLVNLQSGQQWSSKRRRKRSSTSEHEETWCPPKDRRQSRAVSTTTQSSQTLPSQFQVTRQVSHSDLQQLQLDTNSSDTTMRLFAHFMRRSTGVNRIIEPNYEPHLVDLHTLFTEFTK